MQRRGRRAFAMALGRAISATDLTPHLTTRGGRRRIRIGEEKAKIVMRFFGLGCPHDTCCSSFPTGRFPARKSLRTFCGAACGAAGEGGLRDSGNLRAY